MADVRTRERFARRRGSALPLLVLALALSLLTLLPLLALIFTAFAQSSGAAFAHYATTLLPGYSATTAWLCLLVGVGVAVVGVVTAWLVTMCRFPGAAVFRWALVLPLAMPGYVSAYAYTYLLQHPGPVQAGFRQLFELGPRDYWFPDIRSVEGAAFVLSMVLYPYVYLLARAAFLQQSASAFEAARTLGHGPWRAFLRVAVPMARPAVVAGVALAVMETAADYGTVAHFGVQTFTTAIYRTWFSMGDRVAAVQLSLILVAFVLLVIALERVGRGGRRFSESRAGRPMPPMVLGGWRAAAATMACAVPLALGFVVPAGTLLGLALSLNVPWFDERMLSLIRNTVVLGAVGAAVTVLVAVIIAYGRRLSTRGLTRVLGGLASFGYAVPGAVIAVGLLLPFGAFDRWFHHAMAEAFGIRTGLLLTGTLAAVVFAYMVRFLAVSLNGVEAGLHRIPVSFAGASRSLGVGPFKTFCRIDVPLLAGALVTALLITFVDIMKELPATLILRPFNFDTLAIRAHRLASDERLAMAAVPSLCIVAVGLLPVIILTRQITRTGRKTQALRAGVLQAPVKDAIVPAGTETEVAGTGREAA